MLYYPGSCLANILYHSAQLICLMSSPSIMYVCVCIYVCTHVCIYVCTYLYVVCMYVVVITPLGLLLLVYKADL